QAALAAALQAYFEGRYSRAEKEASVAWQAGVSPGVAALVGARSAHQLREFERRDEWLQRARRGGGTPPTAARPPPGEAPPGKSATSSARAMRSEACMAPGPGTSRARGCCCAPSAERTTGRRC